MADWRKGGGGGEKNKEKGEISPFLVSGLGNIKKGRFLGVR